MNKHIDKKTPPHPTRPTHRYYICEHTPLYSFKPRIGFDKLASSMKRIQYIRCSVVGCTDQHKSLHRTPASEDTRAKWIDFIFEANVPARIGKDLLVCANHFELDCFTSLGQYNCRISCGGRNSCGCRISSGGCRSKIRRNGWSITHRSGSGGRSSSGRSRSCCGHRRRSGRCNGVATK